jgi:hypothetical protein
MENRKNEMQIQFCKAATATKAMSMKLLIEALWRRANNPCAELHELYNEFVAGGANLYDAETGLTFRPCDFRQNAHMRKTVIRTYKKTI